jgi:hypothetical protein
MTKANSVIGKHQRFVDDTVDADLFLLQGLVVEGEVTMLRHICGRWPEKSTAKTGSAVICRSVIEGANAVCWADTGKDVR